MASVTFRAGGSSALDLLDEPASPAPHARSASAAQQKSAASTAVHMVQLVLLRLALRPGSGSECSCTATQRGSGWAAQDAAGPAGREACPAG